MFLTADKFILAQNAKSSNKVIPFSENVSPKKNLCTRGKHWQMRYCKIFQQTSVILSLNVQKQLWKIISFSEKYFLLETTLYICELQLRLLCQKNTGRSPSCLRSISKQTNEPTLFSKKTSWDWSSGYVEGILDKVFPNFCWQSPKMINWESESQY